MYCFSSASLIGKEGVAEGKQRGKARKIDILMGVCVGLCVQKISSICLEEIRL